MITSKVLGKSYKTKAAYKGQITKYKKHIQSEYDDRVSCRSKGWKLYLGDPILKQINILKYELLRIEREIKINL